MRAERTSRRAAVGGEESVMKKILWTAMLSVVSGLGAALASRALDLAWRKATQEEPPKIPMWARFLVAKPLRFGVDRGVPAPKV
jgi:hypothetical protein